MYWQYCNISLNCKDKFNKTVSLTNLNISTNNCKDFSEFISLLLKERYIFPASFAKLFSLKFESKVTQVWSLKCHNSLRPSTGLRFFWITKSLFWRMNYCWIHYSDRAIHLHTTSGSIWCWNSINFTTSHTWHAKLTDVVEVKNCLRQFLYFILL